MSAIIFLGPSAPLRAARTILDADYRPPVRHGDIWRALDEKPVAIGVIDGVFEQEPAVWHKELLEALVSGVHVFGASSMGALRAAELHPFGMRGVGAIFERFRDGVWEDDDEVALRHGPPETGYVGLSEPMANVRFTLEAALGADVVDADDARLILNAAKAVFYPERDWKRIDAAAAEAGLGSPVVERFAAWRAEGRVDQKRRDALMMLAEMKAFLDANPAPHAPRFDFARTNLAEYAKAASLKAD